jgi:hypothetical protein
MLIASGTGGEVPSVFPQNAALVYYQACLFRCLSLKPPAGFRGIVSGTFGPNSDPNEAVASFVRSRDYQFLIELVTAASRLPQCDWGLVHRQQVISPTGGIARVDDLTSFLIVQAKVFACDGQYRAALENVLTLRRIARHFGDDMLTLYVQAAVTDARAFDLIRYVLGKMPPDVETLTWLHGQLAAGGEMEWRPRETLAKWLDWEVQYLQASPDVLAAAMRKPALRKKTEGLTGAQVLERARQGWEEVFESVLEVLESEMSPQDKSRALGQLEMKVFAKISGAEAAAEVWESEKSAEEKEEEIKQLLLAGRDNMDPMGIIEIGHAVDFYSRYAYLPARVHAVQAAIAVYLIKARTGQLPQTLPTDLPKDPYTGKDFEYQVTERGFILRCRGVFPAYGSSGPNPEPMQLEFQVAEGQ